MEDHNSCLLIHMHVNLTEQVNLYEFEHLAIGFDINICN
jgi:hypothetical protein